ncbi:hypothetical protein GCM10025734_45870 [Kitasatospora paranensis]
MEGAPAGAPPADTPEGPVIPERPSRPPLIPAPSRPDTAPAGPGAPALPVYQPLFSDAPGLNWIGPGDNWTRAWTAGNQAEAPAQPGPAAPRSTPAALPAGPQDPADLPPTPATSNSSGPPWPWSNRSRTAPPRTSTR